ncbi:MAG: hypothetical protein K2X27_03155 [Candidatus Obscuribacterales bacterium]|nr:hypothetical protein [Candidatus Obscuribacterales bacterium]
MKRRIIFLALAALCFASAFSAFQKMRQAEKKMPDLMELLEMPKTAMQMRLYSAQRNAANGQSLSGKTLGFEYYKNNGQTKSHVHNEFESGAAEDIYFRADGSKESSQDYFPAARGMNASQLRSKAEFALDGSTYTKHEVYTQTGLLERRGQLLGTGLYQQSYYCADGASLKRDRLFDAGKHFLSEKIFDCSSKKLIAEVFPGQYESQVYITLYREDGSKLAYTTKDYAGLSGTLFAEDGVTAIGEFSSSSSAMNIQYYDGSPERITQSWTSFYGRTKIIVFDPNTQKKLYLQEWKERPGDSPGLKKLILVKVTEYSQDKDNDWSREVEMSSDGKSIATVTRPLGSTPLAGLSLAKSPATEADFESKRRIMRLTWSFDKSDRLIKFELAFENQSFNNTEQPLQSALPAPRDISAERLLLPKHVELPVFEDLGPERIYDYP